MGLVVASCSEKSDRPSAKAPSAPAPTVVVTMPPEVADAAPTVPNDPQRIVGDPSAVAFLDDGALAIATDKELVLVDVAGRMQRVDLRGRTAKLDHEGRGEGIVLEGASDVALLETPTLRQLYSGPGYALSRPPQAIATAGTSPSVLVQLGGKLARFTLPPGKAKRVDGVDLAASGRYAVVTWSIEDTMQADAAVFETATGRLVGRVHPMPVFAIEPLTTLVGDAQIAIDQGKVSIIDLATAAVVRSAKVACPKDSFLGNPTTAAGADLVLVTCGSDGISLDAKTLAPRRRYARIMPGCDNGNVLGGRFDAKTKSEVVLEGCGGIARLDLVTGHYRCSDEIGLAGADYEIIPSGANGPTRRAPPGRENLPRCTKDDEAASMRLSSSASGAYTIVYGEGGVLTVLHAGGRIALDEGASSHTFSRDEKQLAYTLKDRVIVRSLPAGTVLREIVRR